MITETVFKHVSADDKLSKQTAIRIDWEVGTKNFVIHFLDYYMCNTKISIAPETADALKRALEEILEEFKK